MAVYDKIVRLTIPLDEDYILLVSMDNENSVEKTPKIVDSIKIILNN